MELLVFLILCMIGLLCAILWYGIRIYEEIRYTRNFILKTLGTTQSTIRSQKRSDKYPILPRPKAEQHYEGKGVPRPKPGEQPRAVTASGTPVRIGKVAQRRAGGSQGDPSAP